MSFAFEILWPAKKLQFSLINFAYFFIFATNFHSHLLDHSFKQCGSFDKLDQLLISFKMIYNMTIFENFFLSYRRSKVNFYPFPMKTPAYDNVYLRFFNSYRTSLASSAGFVSQLENSYGTYN